jgi:hypothetical protein
VLARVGVLVGRGHLLLLFEVEVDESPHFLLGNPVGFISEIEPGGGVDQVAFDSELRRIRVS